jgi:hypothetical protein
MIAKIAGIEKQRLIADERGFSRIGKSRIRMSFDAILGDLLR